MNSSAVCLVQLNLDSKWPSPILEPLWFHVFNHWSVLKNTCMIKNLFLELSWMVWWLLAFAPPYTCRWCRSGELLLSSESISRLRKNRIESSNEREYQWLVNYEQSNRLKCLRKAQESKSSCSCYSTHLEVTNSSTGHGLALDCGLIFLFTHYGNKLWITCFLV